jgi:uncharacterized protein (DUF1015 family)
MDALALHPFRGLRFAHERVDDPAVVISPPYDMIDLIQAHRLAESDSHNIVRLILPELDEPDPRLRYRRAARTLSEWRAEGALVLDAEPALYVYEQDGPLGLQRGLIGALQLPANDTGPVLPHEDVVDAVVADRRALMYATGSNPEPILLTYSGGGPASELVEQVAAGQVDPVVDVSTVDGTRHRLWAVTDPAEHELAAADLAGRQALIADGHHRYAAYRRLAELQHPGTDRGLALLVDTTTHPLTVQGIHRWLPELAAEPAIEAAAKWFTVTEVNGGYRAALAALAEIGPERIALAVVDGENRAWLLTDPDPQLLARTIPADRPESWRRLDATVLHYALAGEVWRILDTADNIHFDHDAKHAVIEAHRHRGLAVLVRPVAEATVMELASAGVRMPRKSTAFTPKPATGLVLRLFAEQ